MLPGKSNVWLTLTTKVSIIRNTLKAISYHEFNSNRVCLHTGAKLRNTVSETLVRSIRS